MVDILLPTYNGGQYLSVLLDSILNQTYRHFRIIVRDDGSKDNTSDVIHDYKARYSDVFQVVEDDLGNQGTSGSNSILIKHVEAEYFMFCDQDDIWEPKKIEESMQEMKRLEKLYPDKPILVCTDACCIDENGELTDSSFYASQKFHDVTGSYHKLLALNVVQGATALMNRKVLDYVPWIPCNLFHDWWFAVNVAFYGKVSYLHKPLLRYRQHSSNVVGANHVGFSYITKKLLHTKRQWIIYKNMYKALPFRPNVFKWSFYKLVLNLRRL